MSAPNREDYGKGRGGVEAYRRAVREYQRYGSPSDVASKSVHRNAINDRGVRVGDLYMQKRGGQVEFKNPGGVARANIDGFEDEINFSPAAITVGSQKYYPMQSGDDVIYQRKAGSQRTTDNKGYKDVTQNLTENKGWGDADLSSLMREAPAPNDPNKLESKGTITGLAGGSLSGAYDSDKYLSKFMQDAGIQVQNPFNTAPLPGSYAHYGQIALNPGVITADDIDMTGGFPKIYDKDVASKLRTEFSKEGGLFTMPVDMESFVNQEMVSAMEASQAPIGSGAELGENKLSGLSARSRAFLDYDGPGGAMGALRAAEATQGLMRAEGKMYSMDQDDKYQEVTKEGARMRASGAIDAQTLLDNHLVGVPEKAIEKVIETGDPESIDPTKSELSQFDQYQQLGESIIAGNELNPEKLYNTTAPEGGGPNSDIMDEKNRILTPYFRNR